MPVFFHECDDPNEVATTCPSCGGHSLTRSEKVIMVGDPEQHRHFLNRLRQQARHLLNVVNDLLDFSKFEAQKMQLYFAEGDVDNVVREVSETLEGLALEKGVNLTYGAPPELKPGGGSAASHPGAHQSHR